jgi:deoxyribose-phosphate aldolase
MTNDITAIRRRVETITGPIAIDHTPYQRVDPAHLASVIDHTLLKPEATPGQIDRLCAEAIEHRFASVCLNPLYVARAVEALRGTGVQVCTVVGFPLGAAVSRVKSEETRQALRDGTTEIDMVLPVGLLIAGEWAQVLGDVRGVVGAAVGAPVKVILETCLLDDAQKIAGSLLAVAAGARYVKTSTGFAGGGATIEDVRLMRATVGSPVGVKAAGGIRTREDALAMLEAGASRLGCSASVAIVTPPHSARQ